jgi:hypothetical protein
MINGFYTPGVVTLSLGAGDAVWASSLDSKNTMPVCLVCCSTQGTLKIEVSNDGFNADDRVLALLDATAGLPFDWMFYVMGKNETVKTTATGTMSFVRVQGSLVVVP